ncbi:MAG: GDP-mannose 4,6-dehydratase [Deltaproteobacteria bacterium]|nr:GDP-mannose 4,6-dehydratase [Deltaproteobacteria bacterium]
MKSCDKILKLGDINKGHSCLFITHLLKDKKVPLYGTGKNTRDWLYVLDHCTAIDRVIHHGKIGEIYNIGGTKKITNLQLTYLLLKLLDKHKSRIGFVADRPEHDLRYSICCKKIKKIGWQPQYDFAAALKDTVEWFKENSNN